MEALLAGKRLLDNNRDLVRLDADGDIASDGSSTGNKRRGFFAPGWTPEDYDPPCDFGEAMKMVAAGEVMKCLAWGADGTHIQRLAGGEIHIGKSHAHESWSPNAKDVEATDWIPYRVPA